MSNQTLSITPELYAYLLDVSLREYPLLKELRELTSQMKEANMQISPEQGQFMQLLVQLSGAKKTIEVGVFTGYSSLAVALALPKDGRITACDISKEWTGIGREFWKRAGLEHKIDLHIAPAAETLNALIQKGESGTYDFAFIDADKPGYDDYYELCLQLLRPGGLIMLDNMLWGGRVLDEDSEHPEARAIRAMNLKIRDDGRVMMSLLPVSDGVTLVVKN